jgi:hypothetical protein
MMDRNMTHGTRGPLARISRRVIAFVSECNDAQTRLSNAQHTPERF